MLLDMALGSKAPTSSRHRCQVTAALLLIVCVTLTNSAPTAYDEVEAKQTDLTDYFNDPNGCYYNYQHYEEGDRIVTNEPCLNCTCHNRMLMCYLRVCPFSKAIGQDCTVQKSPDQCCPVISCPEVPVHLLTSSTTQRSTTTTSTTTEIGWRDDYGCMMNENGFFPDGAQVPSDPKKPCELCYCIRNRTACVMQECTLHVEGCRPVYQDGVCCPVRYDCDYESEKSTTSAPQISGGLVFSTTSAPFDCKVNDEVYRDGESISMVAEKPCEHCYCMRGDIVCAVQDCGEPLRGKDCTPETPPAGQCCPTSYQCPNETMNSYDYLTTLPPTLLSDSDEHEAEKYPSNEDAYEKLGEHRPSQQDDTNDVDFEQPLTTAAYNNELPPTGSSEQSTNKNEATHDSVSENHDTAGEPNVLPESDSSHINSEENKQELSSAKPESTDQVTVGIESDPSKNESTDKPVEPTSIDEAQPTQSPAADSLLNENIVSPTAQTTDNKNSINEGSNNNESSTQIQDAIAPGLPVQPTESSLESETQSSNPQNKLQEGIQQQTDTPAEKEPIQSGNDEQNVDIKSPTETTSHTNQDPLNQNNGENTEHFTEENKIVTTVPLSEDTEQTTQKLIQADNLNTPLENSNAQTDTTSSNVDQNISNQSNQDITQSPQEGNSPTDNKSNGEKNSLNNDNVQEGHISSTEIPKIVNEPVEKKPQDENKPESEITPTEKYQDNLHQENVVSTEIPKIENESNEQNKPLAENDPQTENGPESEVTPTEKYQDGSQSENVMPTEIPKVENESTEQNKPVDDNSQQTENHSDSVQTTIETNNLESSQAENMSPTEIPKLENEPNEQNKPLVESSPQTESQPGSNKTPTEQTEDSTQDENASPTQISTIENEPNEQNKPFIESSPQTESQPESDKTSTGQNQDETQNENASPTEIPNIVSEPTEQNKPLMESSPQSESQSESGQSPTGQNQDGTQDENASPTEIPTIVSEPTEQNKPLVESSTQIEGQAVSDHSPTGQNQDGTQDENASPTEIPNIASEPTEQTNKPLGESSPQTEGQSESDQTPTEQNQDDTQDENALPTEIPSIASEPTEQNKPLVESSPQTEGQSESDQTPTEQNQDDTQDENALPTEIPSIASEPTEQNKPLVESSPQTDGQSESDQTPTEQNQDDTQNKNALPTEIPSIASEPTEQNKPLVESSPQTEDQSESDQTPMEQNQDDTQDENALPTEIPSISSEPTEQNKPLVESSPQTEGQSESDQTPTEQNQDDTQDENALPTEIPSIASEPTEQNKPLVESSPQTEGQSESDKTPTEQNQDDTQDENALPTEIPSIASEPIEQNKPLVESSPQTESQPESDKTPTEQNQDSTQDGNALPTEIPNVVNEPTEQNMPLAESSPPTDSQAVSGQSPTGQNQDGTQDENASPTEIPTIVSEPTEQNKPLVESSPQTEGQSESGQSPTEQNQNGAQDENESPSEIPNIASEPTELNKPLMENSPQTESQSESDKLPTGQNQDSTEKDNVSSTELPKIENQDAQSENISPTEIPKVENEPTQNNIPLLENIAGTENQSESNKLPTKQSSQDISQLENVTPTEIPNVQREPIEQNKPIEENISQTENPLESDDKTLTKQQNQENVQGENVSSTETSKVVSETTEQNKPLGDGNTQTESQPESDRIPTEQNQDGIQENASSTQIPNIESEPTEQNKPLVESSPYAENQPEPPKTLAEENQNNPQVESISSTEIPSKLNEPQSENAVTENAPVQPVASVIPINDVSTEHPIEDNNIFVIVPTSPSLLSQNQVKGDELSSNSTGSGSGDKATTLAENDESKIVENAPSSADDKTSSTEKTNMENASAITSTETASENSNVSPQSNDENTEHSTETKPVGNEVSVEVSNDVTIAPAVDSHASTPIIATEFDSKFGSNNPESLEPSATSTTESNDGVNPGIINQDVLVDDVSSQENDSENGNDEGTPILDSSEHQITPQTDSPTETESSTNADTPAVNEPVNDVTTSLPQQQQVTDNSIPVVLVEAINPSEPIKMDDKTEAPSVPSENTVPEKSQDSHVPTEVGGVQHSDEITKPTESSILDASGVGQSIPTQDSVQINENENVTPHVQSQDENVNEIEDHTSVYPDTSSNDENNSNTANGLVQNNEESSTPLSDKIETGTNEQNTGEEPVKINDDVVPVENESSTISQMGQVNQGNSENADTIETTNSYTEIPSIASITNAPTSTVAENDANPSVNPSNDVETNVKNDRPANVEPQQSVNSDETSTQYNAYDISTNGPIQETPNVNINNNVETSTNIPSYSEIPNEVNQDSITETELYATQSPTEKNVLTDNSDKTPTNDATMEAISNLSNQSNNLQTNTNEIINGYPSEGSDKPTVLKTPDYVIDMTTVSSSELPNINSGSIETGDQANAVNEVTTSNIDKNNDVTTVLYDNEQAGVPGEGSCLIDFVTYAHKSEVPKSNPCHEKCECLNSIVTCTSVNCPPAPPQHRNCIPLHPGNESWCCPTYMCEGGIEGVLFESNNKLGSPQLISTVVLEDKPGEENDDKTNVDEEVSSTSSPQIAEYNTVPPSQTDTANDNSQYPTSATEVSAPNEIPNKPLENSVATGSDNDIPATTAVSFETVENDKPIESNKPANAGDKPAESEQPSENEKPVESDQPLENEKPTESDQSTENETNDSEAGVTTASYVANEQTVTNKPEGANNIEGQNGLPSAVNESQDNLLPSTEVPNYESAVTNVIPTNDQNVPEENSGLDDSVTATTYKPNDSIVDDNKTEEDSPPMVDEKHDTVPVAVGVTDLPESDVNQPIEVTQTPTIIADANPTAVENNVNGLRPTSIDDIISSVNMVKDAVKNSLETSSRPAEIDYQTTTGSAETAENYQPTVVPENAVDPSSENALVDKYDEPLTTVSSVNVVPELQTDDVNEKLPESPAVTVPSDEVGSVQVLNISPSANADQGVSTEIPLYVPDKYEIESSSAVADVNVNQPEVPVDDKNADVTTTQNLPSLAAEQDQTSNGPTTGTSDAGVPQVDVEHNTNLPETVANDDKTPAEVTTPVLPSFAHQGVHTDDDAASKPAEQDKPNAESPLNPEANADKTPAEEVPTQSTVGHSPTTEYAVTGTPDMDDKRFGVPSSSPATTGIHEDSKRPQESSGDMVNIPFDTEKPLTKPSSSTPASAPYASSKPSYTPIPQSTWTQKPFHQDSTSESPQPDQGFPDEYDDENEAVYGPGTCRYGGKVYVSAQQVPREDPCDFCFCFRGDIICLQQSCPPPIFGCYQENIQGFCCPRYECPVAQATSVNVTTTTTTTTTMVPPHFFANAYRGAARRTGCLIHGHAYRVGEDVGIASGPCLECICGADGKMKCDPKPCSPEPLLRKIMAEAVDQRKKR